MSKRFFLQDELDPLEWWIMTQVWRFDYWWICWKYRWKLVASVLWDEIDGGNHEVRKYHAR